MSENKHSRFVGFDRLKQSVSMEQVLQRYGLLERLRRSGESLSGVCPVHRGHNPTQFRVNLSQELLDLFWGLPNWGEHYRLRGPNRADRDSRRRVAVAGLV